MAQTAEYVTPAKPKTGGAGYVAPLGTDLPTDATTALAAAFKATGYITTDGLVNSMSVESASVKAWGGDTVMNSQTGKAVTFKVTFMEAMNVEVLKLVYGDSNVTGTSPSAATGIKISVDSSALEDHVFVFDMILKGNVMKRIVIPHGTVTAVDDITYKDDTPIGYGVTITAAPDTNGKASYEYIKTQGGN